ncbi:protein daughterless-like [Formica exsecta]|uniref:protein daughterless-like n=1 Tax=Formica exsecta TaxID=72781 RepID=UPI0011414169|nr:protein daughterless-like [Formica exsecta]
MHLPHNPRIFPMDQSVSNYSSNPPMSINLPPPLTDSIPGWTPGAAPVSPHFTADPNPGIHMLVPEQQRLDDAIDVLRDLGPVDTHGGIYSHISSSQLDPLTSPPSAVTVTQCQGSYPGLTPTPNIDDSIKRERLPVTNAEKRIDLLVGDSKTKLSRGKLVAAGVIWDDTVDSTSQRKGTKRSRRSSCSSAHEDCDNPDTKREEERRQAKNVSERKRTRELNKTFKKLANKYSDQSQTKLNILSMVVEMINKLEQQVTEQHPSVSIEEWRDFWLDLRREEEAKEEEERASDGPDLPGYLATHIAYPHSHLLAHFQSLFPTLFGPQSSLQHNPPQPQ